MESRPSIPVYILAGGSNRRFGSDKARALLRGEPLLRHVVAALAGCASSVSVIAERADKYADLGLRTLADREPRLGPVGGLARALEDLAGGPGGWLLLAPCDLLAFQPEWLPLLLDRRCAAVQAVAFYAGGRWQPLPALFHVEALGRARALLDQGQRALWRLIASLPHASVPLPDDWGRAVQVNTVEDLAVLARRPARG